jgi:hypothetical protein
MRLMPPGIPVRNALAQLRAAARSWVADAGGASVEVPGVAAPATVAGSTPSVEMSDVVTTTAMHATVAEADQQMLAAGLDVESLRAGPRSTSRFASNRRIALPARACRSVRAVRKIVSPSGMRRA